MLVNEARDIVHFVVYHYVEVFLGRVFLFPNILGLLLMFLIVALLLRRLSMRARTKRQSCLLIGPKQLHLRPGCMDMPSSHLFRVRHPDRFVWVLAPCKHAPQCTIANTAALWCPI